MLSRPGPCPGEKQHIGAFSAAFLHPVLALPTALRCLFQACLLGSIPTHPFSIRAHLTLILGPSTLLLTSLPDKLCPAEAQKLVMAPIF